MKKNLLLLILLLSVSLSTLAQSQQPGPPSSLHCQWVIDEILRNQPFDIDDVVSESARYIVYDIWQHLGEFYVAQNANDSAAVETAISSLDHDLEEANNLSMNLSMFDADFQEVETEKTNE